MRVLDENGDAAHRVRLLGRIARKRRSAELRRRDADRFDAEADDLQVEADALARNLAAARESAA